jgi:nitroreductase
MPMTVTEALNARRSIRKFVPGETIPKEKIDSLLEAAMLAPSACNTRPWEFVAITNRSVLDQIRAFHPFTGMLETAPLAIVICGLPDSQSGISEGFFPQDCGAAAMSILLKAVELGLGACWCGVYPREQLVDGIKSMLDLSSVPFCVIAVGVPDTTARQRGFFDAKKVTYIE